MMRETIGLLIAETASAATKLRKVLHKVPEAAGMEFETAAILRRSLVRLPVELYPPFLQTDVVALLRGRASGSNVLLRADIDALPMTDGFRHACGHDGHAAILWGTAAVLSDIRDHWNGQVLFVFQPGEEIRAMATDLIAAGVLNDFPANGAFALHGWPGIPERHVQTRIGPIMAAAGFFCFRLEGLGGHGSRPELALNPLPVASKLIERLTELPGRLSTCEKTIVTVCRVSGGSNENVIPDKAIVEGTTRFLNELDGELIRQALHQISENIAKETGVPIRLEYRTPYPPTINDPVAVERVRHGFQKLAPWSTWQELSESSMSSEDFAYFLHKVPGAYFHLGLGETWPPLHSPEFEFNDRVIATGITFLVSCVLAYQKTDSFSAVS